LASHRSGQPSPQQGSGFAATDPDACLQSLAARLATIGLATGEGNGAPTAKGGSAAHSDPHNAERDRLARRDDLF